MAHAALHFALGMTAGMAIAAPRLRQAWTARKGLASATRHGLVSAWAFGTLAIVPSLLRYVGLPESFCSGWWMNVFLLHPLINAILPQSAIAGGAAFIGVLTVQYVWMVAAIARAKRAFGRSPP